MTHNAGAHEPGSAELYPQPPRLEPYRTAMQGWAPQAGDAERIGIGDWPNTVSVRVLDGIDPGVVTEYPPGYLDQEDGQDDYADTDFARSLVEIDTNYKDTRPGQHPVRLTRMAALELAVHVLAAAEDTFHYGRVGRLRAAEAAELLSVADRVQYALQDLREHALLDLVHDAALDDSPARHPTDRSG